MAFPEGPTPGGDLAALAAEAERWDRHIRRVMGRIQRLVLRLGKSLKHMEARRLCQALGFSGVTHYAEMRGIGPPARAMDLLRIGGHLEAFPSALRRFLGGEIGLESASSLTLVASVETEERWLAEARQHTTAGFRALVRQEQVRRGERLPFVRKTLDVPDEDVDHFRQACEQVHRDLGRAVSEGEALGVISRHYVQCRSRGRRGRPPTGKVLPEGLPGARYVPADVVRLVWRRDGGRCRVPG